MQELQPQIAELLRTCIHPPSLRLRVAHVKFIDVNRDRTEPENTASDPLTESPDSAYRYATKLILTDGELMIQSLLQRKLRALVDVAGVSIGDLVEITSFRVKRSSRLGGRGHIVYLAIEDCHILKGRPSGYIESDLTSHGKRKLSDFEDSENSPSAVPTDNEPKEVFYSAEESAQGALKRPRLAIPEQPNPDFQEQEQNIELVAKMTTLKSHKRVSFTSPTRAATTSSVNPMSASASAGAARIKAGQLTSPTLLLENNVPKTNPNNQKSRNHNRDDDDDDDFFESTQTSHSLVHQRRQALRSLDQNALGKGFLTDTGCKAPQPTSLHDATSQVLSKPQETAKPWSSASGGTILWHPSPPFHTLRSLRSPAINKPLPSKSYTLTTLAFITWTGSNLIHRPGSPFPPKRHLKIVDPSLAVSRPPSREANSIQQNSPADSVPSFKSQNSFQEAVTLAVYLDASTFRPPSGTLALFRGVVMQRLHNGDIILNVYARLKEVRFDDRPITDSAAGKHWDPDGSHEHHSKTHEADTHWFTTDHHKIRSLGYGSRLDYYLDWWKNRDV